VDPLLFGQDGSQLFGIHHPPRAVPARDLAVVLCGANADEQINARRAFRVLADRLARDGFHVLRFDYFGTGDSAGSGDDVTLERWRADVNAALDSLRVRSRLLRTALIGLRVGAALAAAVAAERHDVEALVLWEPVVRGADYLTEIRARHRDWLQRLDALCPGLRDRVTNHEVLGHPLPPALARGLNTLDLRALERTPAPRIMLLHEQPSTGGECGELERRWRDDGAQVDARELDAGRVWACESAVQQALVPARLLEQIADWMSEVRI
jgi:uncharacterized protein